MTDSEPVRDVLAALHEHTNLCAGADTCAAREVIEPLVAEVERLREALAIACRDSFSDPDAAMARYLAHAEHRLRIGAAGDRG